MAHIEHPNTNADHQTQPTSHSLACLVPSSLEDYRVRCSCVTPHAVSSAS